MSDRRILTRSTDSKGRLTLGEPFANRTVIIEERAEGEFILRLARVIPAREAWLYENPKALKSLRDGLHQARQRKFAKAPDLDAAARLASQLPDDQG
jgi:hypothetical protein